MSWQPREPPLIVVDDSFVLDRWRSGDGPALHRFDLDPETARFFGYSVEQAAAMPDSHYDGDARARGSLRAWREGKQLNLAIRRNSDGEAVGWVELRPAGDRAEVSYNVTAELRGQGIAPRALTALLAWAASQIRLRQAQLACRVDNLASRRVAEKCGFVLVGQDGDEYRFERNLDPRDFGQIHGRAPHLHGSGRSLRLRQLVGVGMPALAGLPGPVLAVMRRRDDPC